MRTGERLPQDLTQLSKRRRIEFLSWALVQGVTAMAPSSEFHVKLTNCGNRRDCLSPIPKIEDACRDRLDLRLVG